MRVRAALVQTVNAYRAMPEGPQDLPRLADLRRANLAHSIELAAEAKGMGALVVCLGLAFTEPWGAPWPPPEEDPRTGPTAKALCRAAYEHGLILVAPLAGGAAVFDERGVALGPCGVVHTAAGPLGLLDGPPGAEVLFAPRAWPGPDAPARLAHETLDAGARRRVFVGGLNRLGVEKPLGHEFAGGSLFAGPGGERLENLSQHPNLVVCDLDLSLVPCD